MVNHLYFIQVERFGATPFGLRPHTQGSGFRVEKAPTVHITDIVDWLIS
jgi:hypothetical protein